LAPHQDAQGEELRHDLVDAQVQVLSIYLDKRPPEHLVTALDRLEQGLSKRLALADSKLSEARARLPQKGGDDFRKERLQKLSDTVALAAKLPGLLSKLRARGGLGLLKALL
jgi:hypothetical protein